MNLLRNIVIGFWTGYGLAVGLSRVIEGVFL